VEGVDKWLSQLRASGFAAEIFGSPNMVVFPFTVPVGRFAGEETKIGVLVPPDDLQPPSGIHVSPRLLPLHPDQSVGHPTGGVHAADHLGPDWEYWSRPFHTWMQTSRDATAYLRFIHRLFATT
jgi:hypothetical protein